jgi:multicomponent Na+:H+ antiporter subunit A
MRFRPSLLMDIGARSMVPTLVLVSLYVLVVGHDEPGGGFIGGLLAGVALLVVFLAGGASQVTKVLPIDPLTIVGAGMSVAVATSVAGMVVGAGLLDAGKLEIDLPWVEKLSVGSTLVFDTGVYLIVVGLVAMVLTRLGVPEEASP